MIPPGDLGLARVDLLAAFLRELELGQVGARGIEALALVGDAALFRPQVPQIGEPDLVERPVPRQDSGPAVLADLRHAQIEVRRDLAQCGGTHQ